MSGSASDEGATGLQPERVTLAGVAMISKDGAWRVEPIRLDRGDGPRLMYRITRHGIHQATVATTLAIEPYVSLADLVDEDAPEDGCLDA